jgi:hypothetical protein
MLCQRPTALYDPRTGSAAGSFPMTGIQSESLLRPTVSLSVCLGVEPQIFILIESYSPVHMGRPL